MLHDIFLSYNRVDKRYMQIVLKTLQKSDLTVWTDSGDALIGTTNWQREIKQAIDNASCLICILTPKTDESDWVLEELSYARLHDKEIHLILMAGSLQESTIFGYGLSQIIDVREKQLYMPRMQQLINYIKQNYGERRLTQFVETTAVHNRPFNSLAKGIQSAKIPEDEIHLLIVKVGREKTPRTKAQMFRPSFTIGRSAENTFVVEDKLISRKHCQLLYTESGVLLRDFATANGTFVNGQRIISILLTSGDKIRVGSITMEYRLKRKI